MCKKIVSPVVIYETSLFFIVKQTGGLKFVGFLLGGLLTGCPRNYIGTLPQPADLGLLLFEIIIFEKRVEY